MKIPSPAAIVVILAASITLSPAAPRPMLERGRDLVETPVNHAGLCLSNLFQSKLTGKNPATPGVLQRNERQELTRALRAADLQRRVAEARALLDEARLEGTR